MTWHNPDRTTSWSSAIRIRTIGENSDELLQTYRDSPLPPPQQTLMSISLITQCEVLRILGKRLASVRQLPRVERTKPRCRGSRPISSVAAKTHDRRSWFLRCRKLTISPGERPFSSVAQNKCHSSMALCWPFVCDGAGAHGTPAEELCHSECSAKRRNQKTAGSTRKSKKGAGCHCGLSRSWLLSSVWQ